MVEVKNLYVGDRCVVHVNDSFLHVKFDVRVIIWRRLKPDEIRLHPNDRFIPDENEHYYLVMVNDSREDFSLLTVNFETGDAVYVGANTSAYTVENITLETVNAKIF